MIRFFKLLWTEFSYYLPASIRYHYVKIDGHEILWPRWGFTKKEHKASDKWVKEMTEGIKWE